MQENDSTEIHSEEGNVLTAEGHRDIHQPWKKFESPFLFALVENENNLFNILCTVENGYTWYKALKKEFY